MRNIILVSLLLLSACSSNVSDTDTSGCDENIKGNLTTYNGEKIYHVPGGQFYDVTDAEEMFCTEEEAEEAGYRKSMR
ncbi:hypothetical protein I6J18_00080 (plasmid) [Peribacillus psychrosaccharolyticus]|uniref:Uncharacterized protein n=1 Tax=Peribacillus psychrosaccharolyticus TaxID=1407 RepID=A0A974NIC7_PERPY|nr:hypothetical protein [Peribacillus psychrosaccharolyticus]MEC2054199.1 hypothetical protein [Peribacillus psychrosaccharolyticus]MED3746550.1 hypothetical protein [Peribacillus psychrosaccharolyticus]QQS98441.1 hypothetical protein I6J18_00080 [Peribacillus psychrosaccharolyticus]